MTALRSVTLRKANGHTFIFRYAPGDEPLVQEALMDLAKRHDITFDWWDAATTLSQVLELMAPQTTGTIHATD